MQIGMGVGLGFLNRIRLPIEPPAIPDYIVTNDAEWTSLIAISAATLSGKTAEIRGALGNTAVPAKAFTTPFVVQGGVGGSVRRVEMTGVISNITFKNLPFQMTGWPATNAETFYLNGGTYTGLRFDGCTFRHGYGAGLLDLDPVANYPEYTRVGNVRTATTTSVTTALSWQDPVITQGFIEFFNRGSQTVYFDIGGAGVTATVASTPCPAGTKVRTATLNPTTDTHIAVLAASGTAEVNARAEIGIVEYLANTFASSGSANVVDVTYVNCECRDINNGFKGMAPASSFAVLLDCRTRRVYQDQSAIAIKPGASGYIMRNSFGLPFARSGIAENLNGDARDPHGDIGQSFGFGTGTIGPLYYAGNRQYMQPVRAGTTSQGLFISDNDFTPSYDGFYSISDTMLAGSPNGINSGEPTFPAAGVMIYGATVVDPRDITSQTRFRFDSQIAERPVYIGKSLSVGISGSGMVFDTSLDLTGITDPATVFANLSAANTATTRAALESALATVGPASGIGAVATIDAIDWTTTDHTQIIKWDQIPSGVEWANVTAQAINALITLPLRRVLNRRASQVVTPGAGVEWRATATDGTTEAQAWTSSGGTIQPNQFIQIRKQSSTSGLTAVNFDITINGFLQTLSVTTVSAAPAIFHTQSGTGPYFRDPTNAVPAITTRMEWAANVYPTAISTGNARIFSQESTGCDLEMTTTGQFRLTVEDASGTAVVSASFATLGYDINQWQELVLDVNHTTGTASLLKNGVLAGSWSWTPTATPTFNTTREISFFANSSGANPLSSGWQIEYAECYFTTSGTRSLRKRVEGNAATVNADAWKLGSDAVSDVVDWPPVAFAVTRDFGGTGSSTLQGNAGGSTPTWNLMNTTRITGGTVYDATQTVPASGGVLTYNGGVGGSGSPEILARVNGTAVSVPQRFIARMLAMDLVVQLGGAYGAGVAPEDAVRTDAASIVSLLGHPRFVFAHKHYDAIAASGSRDHTRLNRQNRLDQIDYPGKVEHVALMFNKATPFDANDIADQVLDKIPRSLQFDTAHPNTAGNSLILDRCYLPFRWAMETGNGYAPHQDHEFNAPTAINTNGVVVGTIPHHPSTTIAGSTFATNDANFSALLEAGAIVLRRATTTPITAGYTDIALDHTQAGIKRRVHQRVRIKDTTGAEGRAYINSQFMAREKALSNLTNGGKKFSFAMLVRVVSGDGVQRAIASSTAGIYTELRTTNRMMMNLRNTADTALAINLDSGTGANLITAASGWRAAFFCCDTTTGAQTAKWIIDDNAAVTAVPTADETFNIFNPGNYQHRLFSFTDAGSRLCDIECGGIWMAADYVDFAIAGNRNAFRNSGTMRSVLSGTGAIAGVTPFLWMQGVPGNWSSGLNLAAPGDFWDCTTRAQITAV